MTDHNARQAGLTQEQKAQFVHEICEMGTEFATPLFAIVESVERAVIAAHSADASNGNGNDTTPLDDETVAVIGRFMNRTEETYNGFIRRRLGIGFGRALRRAIEDARNGEGVALTDEVREALKLAEKTIDILWVSHHATRADAALVAIRRLLSAPAVSAPQGWKLVPVEPTQEMAAAYLSLSMKSWRQSYIAMLDAAPAAPASEPDYDSQQFANGWVAAINAAAHTAREILGTGVVHSEIMALTNDVPADAASEAIAGVTPMLLANAAFCIENWHEVPAEKRQSIIDKLLKASHAALPASDASEAGADAARLLAADHKGMKVDYSGLFKQACAGLRREPSLAEMLRQLKDHITELGRRWYAGDTAVVDELLQLYCVEREARAAMSNQAQKGGE